MKSPADIEKLLERFGSAWPDDQSVVDRVMREIHSTPARPAISKGRRIIVKSLLAIAASLMACVVLWWAFDGNHNSLYAQVIDAARKARTIHIIHYGLLGREAKPVKLWESWYAKGVGFVKSVASGGSDNETIVLTQYKTN